MQKKEVRSHPYNLGKNKIYFPSGHPLKSITTYNVDSCFFNPLCWQWYSCHFKQKLVKTHLGAVGLLFNFNFNDIHLQIVALTIYVVVVVVVVVISSWICLWGTRWSVGPIINTLPFASFCCEFRAYEFICTMLISAIYGAFKLMAKKWKASWCALR